MLIFYTGSLKHADTSSPKIRVRLAIERETVRIQAGVPRAPGGGAGAGVQTKENAKANEITPKGWLPDQANNRFCCTLLRKSPVLVRHSAGLGDLEW